jgi:hypothetical protein
MVEGRNPQETALYQSLHDRYVFNLKEKVLEPFLENANFRRASRETSRFGGGSRPPA